jgi:hypothetical protein
MKRYLQSGYNRRSLFALSVVILFGVAVSATWSGLLLQNLAEVDWFLIATWVLMTALVCWDVRPGPDLTLALVALAGGLSFEWWGTRTQLWWYFTSDQPPLWILPAWPMAALASDRIARRLEAGLSARPAVWRVLYWVGLGAFTLAMIRFIWPSIAYPLSQIAAIMILLTVSLGIAPKRDTCLFLGGSLLGIALEYWGTSRACWTYYTHQTPPIVTILAHGFAQIGYARVLDLLTWGLRTSGA